MTDETFNMSLRKFLKTVGVTSQQQIEAAVRDAVEGGKLRQNAVTAKVVLTINEIGLKHEISGEIDVSGQK